MTKKILYPNFQFNNKEKAILQKLEHYSGISTPFLRELVEEINLSFRLHSDKTKDALLKILCRKLDAEKIDTAFKLYLMCYEAKDVARIVKPKGMSEIVSAVEEFFNKSEVLHEVTVGLRRCDLVIFSGNDINAIEVKSSLDKLSSAVDQLEYYASWANKTYLAYDVKHKQNVKRLSSMEKGFGLLEFMKGEIECIQEASSQEVCKNKLFSVMTYNYLRKIAIAFKVDLKGGKHQIAESVSEKVTQDEARSLFREFLRTRALV